MKLFALTFGTVLGICIGENLNFSSGSRQGQQCLGNGMQCMGEAGKPFVQTSSCCDPHAICMKHPEADSQPGKLWGGWCLKQTQCYLGGQRCQGAQGQPNVNVRPCCSEDDECVDHPNKSSAPDFFWGKFCVNKSISQCVSSGARCEGAAGFPPVQWRPCCNPAEKCIKHPKGNENTGLWGKFCLPSGGKISYPATQKKTLLPGKFTADPSAHVFNGKLYVVTSIDDPAENVVDPNEMYFLMTRYQVMSFNDDLSRVTDEGEILHISTVPWAKKQMWAPDFTCKGKNSEICYLYFPAKDHSDLFRIGVATSRNGPTGPYVAEQNYIPGTFSVDPSIFTDEDGTDYMIWGGEWGGQLEHWNDDKTFNQGAERPKSGTAVQPRLAKLKKNMVEIEQISKLRILKDGKDLQVQDAKAKFFEAAWIHMRGGVHYLSYSVGEEHLLAYAWSDKGVYGPYIYGGTIMSEPVGWTSHQSIVAYKGKTYLFYHDSRTSGRTNLRQVKFQEISYNADGSIVQVSPE